MTGNRSSTLDFLPADEREQCLSLPSLDVEIRFRVSSPGVRLQLPLRVLCSMLTKSNLRYNPQDGDQVNTGERPGTFLTSSARVTADR